MLLSLNELYTKYEWSLLTLDKYMIYEKEILDIFNNNIDSYKYNENLYLWIGNYYYFKENNYDKMKEYYLMAIQLNNSDALQKMGRYYEKIEKDYDKMKEYYLMAIKLNNVPAMTNLAHYYQIIEYNYDKMKEYYLMAIEMHDSIAMTNLAVYYFDIEKNYDKMKKYYLMAIELNNSLAMYNFAIYYQYTEKNMDNAIKYYLMAIKLNNLKAVANLKEITTPLQRYIYYTKNNIPFNEEVTNDIHIYNNKLKKSIIDTCNICFENNQKCILLNCHGHYTCTDCYINIYDKSCPFCRL